MDLTRTVYNAWSSAKEREHIDGVRRREKGLESRVSRYQESLSIFMNTISGKSILYEILTGGSLSVNMDPSLRVIFSKGSLYKEDLYKIAKGILSGYRPVNVDEVNSAPQNNTRGMLERALISNKPFLSEKTYLGSSKPNFGRVEIFISDNFVWPLNWRDAITLTLDDRLERYAFPPGSPNIPTTSDISWDGSPEIEKEPLFLKGNPNSARAYAVVANREELKNLIPQFWDIIAKSIGEDKITSMSIDYGDDDEILVRNEARKHPRFRTIKKHNLQANPHTGQRSQVYAFSFDESTTGILEDRTGGAYILQNKLILVQHYKTPIDINRIISEVERLRFI